MFYRTTIGRLISEDFSNNIYLLLEYRKKSKFINCHPLCA